MDSLAPSGQNPNPSASSRPSSSCLLPGPSPTTARISCPLTSPKCEARQGARPAQESPCSGVPCTPSSAGALLPPTTPLNPPPYRSSTAPQPRLSGSLPAHAWHRLFSTSILSKKIHLLFAIEFPLPMVLSLAGEPRSPRAYQVNTLGKNNHG